MKIEGRTVWQQAAGDTQRNYVDICLRLGVILNGPGAPGHFNMSRSIYERVLSARKVTGLDRFANVMSDGDLVVLRLGTSEAHAVGEIVGDYEWRSEFGDVDGWDLEHVRRVRWLWAKPGNPDQLGTYAFKQGDTTQSLTTDAALDWLRALKVHQKTNELPDLTSFAPPVITMSDVAQNLFDRGMDSSSVDLLSSRLDELVRIAEWYRRTETVPSEHETVSYLVVPFLRAIGWTPQKMGVEWNRVDVALFRSLPRASSNLDFVVEAKKRNTSCLQAASQAANYASTHGCRKLIVTDGIRYGVYRHHYTFKLESYLNLARLVDTSPVLDCGGATDAIWQMTPDVQ